MAYEFFVVMQKRSDGKIYADLHKTDERMYLVEDEADAALVAMGELAKHFHKVKMVGVLADEWHNAALRGDSGLIAGVQLESTVMQKEDK